MAVMVSVEVLIDLRELARKYPGATFAIFANAEAVKQMMAVVQGDNSEEMRGFVWFQNESQLACLFGGIEPEPEAAA